MAQVKNTPKVFNFFSTLVNDQPVSVLNSEKDNHARYLLFFLLTDRGVDKIHFR